MTAADFASTPASGAAERDDSAAQISAAIDAKASELWKINQQVCIYYAYLDIVDHFGFLSDTSKPRTWSRRVQSTRQHHEHA